MFRKYLIKTFKYYKVNILKAVQEMKRINKVLLLLIPMLLFTTYVQVYAVGKGNLRISPALPTMSGTEEIFEIWVEGEGPGDVTVYYPQLFLVMTETCHNVLTKVVIDFHNNGYDITEDATLWPGDFIGETDDDKTLPPGYISGVAETVSALKSHLGIGKSESIYYALVSFPPGDTIIGSPTYKVKITLDSTDPKMLVYLFGKSENSAVTDYDMKVPPTNPGFMVPEPATIAAVATPTLTLLAYALYKRKTIFF